MKQRFGTMVEYYTEDTAQYIQTIQDALNKQDLAAIIAPAHTIDSSSLQLGANTVSKIAKALEQLARENTQDVSTIEQNLQQINEAFNYASTALNQIAGRQ